MLGGLWPLARGRIYKPGGGADDAEGGLSHACFYVPQRPYVTQGTLQEQLVYPLAVSQERIAEPELRRLLAAVDLEYLLDRWAGVAGVGGIVPEAPAARTRGSSRAVAVLALSSKL